MKIMIVENEIYLAQSIAAKLAEIGHYCEVAVTIKDAIKDEHFDAVLLSTNINGQDFYPVIDHYKESIIILLVSYISNDTVSNPLKAGAKDYLLKPFMMEELIRKIHHFRDYELIKKENAAYKKYIEFSLKDISIDGICAKTKLPLLIKTNYQKCRQILLLYMMGGMIIQEKKWVIIQTNMSGVIIGLNHVNLESKIILKRL